MSTTRMPTWRTAFLPAFLVFLALTPGARADFITTFTNEHVDVDLRFEDGKLAIGWHDETNDVEYEAGEAQVFLGANALRPRPAGAAFNFLGVGPGAPVFVLPQVQDPSLVFLGLDSEEIDDGIFQNNQVTLSLLAVRGPGAFSLWSTDAFGMPDVFMASADGVGPSDQIGFPTGSHQDFNWAFTAAGTYEIDLELSGVLANGEVIRSEATTLTFSTVPEPTTGVLVMIGAGALALHLRRRGGKGTSPALGSLLSLSSLAHLRRRGRK